MQNIDRGFLWGCPLADFMLTHRWPRGPRFQNSRFAWVSEECGMASISQCLNDLRNSATSLGGRTWSLSTEPNILASSRPNFFFFFISMASFCGSYGDMMLLKEVFLFHFSVAYLISRWGLPCQAEILKPGAPVLFTKFQPRRRGSDRGRCFMFFFLEVRPQMWILPLDLGTHTRQRSMASICTVVDEFEAPLAAWEVKFSALVLKWEGNK